MTQTKRPPLLVISGGREERLLRSAEETPKKSQPAPPTQDIAPPSPPTEWEGSHLTYSSFDEKIVATYYCDPNWRRASGFQVVLPDGERVTDWIYPTYTDKRAIQRFAPPPVRTEWVRRTRDRAFLRHFYKRKV